MNRADGVSLVCPYCKVKFGSLQGMVRHAVPMHGKKLYDIFEEFYPERLACAKKTCTNKVRRARNWTVIECCSQSCARIGYVQSAEHVRKRVANTDRRTKERTKRSNQLAKSGGKYSNVSQVPSVKRKMRAAALGNVIVRTPEHQRKIIEAKKRNGTLKHTAKAKRRMSVAISRALNDPSFDKSRLLGSGSGYGRGHKHSKIGGLSCRSSYEARFVTACIKHGIEVQSAECKEFSAGYRKGGKPKTYYPDFFMPRRGYVIEIKPASMLKLSSQKLRAGRRRHGAKYRVVTEKALAAFEKSGRIYEHLCPAP